MSDRNIVDSLYDLSLWLRQMARMVGRFAVHIGPFIFAVGYIIWVFLWIVGLPVPLSGWIADNEWWARVIWIALLPATPLAAIVIIVLKKVTNIRVNVVNAAERTWVKPKDVPQRMWNSKIITEGIVQEDLDGNLYVRDLQVENGQLYVDGVPEGLFGDSQLLTWKESVEANRGVLWTWARIGQSMKAKLAALTGGFESRYVNQLASDDLDGSVQHAEIIEGGIRAEIDDYVDSVALPTADDVIADELSDEDAEQMQQGIANKNNSTDLPTGDGDE